MNNVSPSVSDLLSAHRSGDESALESLTSMLYPELKALARHRSAKSAGIGATTLVQETFVKLLGRGTLQPTDRQQFFALSAAIMRNIIIDEIRYVTADKRAGRMVTLDDAVVSDPSRQDAEFLLLLDQVLQALEEEDVQLARAFECRYFAGFTIAETSEALATSVRSAERLWSRARSRVAELMSQ